jgi:hypothetical protein
MGTLPLPEWDLGTFKRLIDLQQLGVSKNIETEIMRL